MRALLVDDNCIARSSLATALQHFGWHVACCSSGDAAVEAHMDAIASVDLVITDLEMPGMNGAELIARLREQVDCPPILLHSGASNRARRNSQPDGFLSKPANLKSLSVAIDALTQSQPSQELRLTSPETTAGLNSHRPRRSVPT